MSQDEIVANVTTIITRGDGSTYSTPLLIIGADSVYVETKDLDLGNSAKEKYLDRIIFDLISADDVPSFYITVGHRDRLNADVTWLEPELVTLPNPQITPRITSRFFTLKFADNRPVSQWQLSRIEFWGQMVEGRL